MMKKTKARDAAVAALATEVAELRELLLAVVDRAERAERLGLGTEQEPSAEPELVNTTEAATLLNLSAFTVRQMCKDGRLPAVKINQRGDWRIPRSAVLDEWTRRYA